MANSSEIRSPSAKVQGEATDSISMSWTVPVSSSLLGNPFVKYSIHKPGGQSAVRPATAEFIKQVAAAQAKMYENPELKDVSLNDGKNSLDFTGYDIGPSYSVAFGTVNNNRALVHKCSRLSALNTSIYTAPADSAAYLGAEEPGEETTPSGYMKLVMETLIKNYEENAPEDDISKAIRDNIHAFNQKILEEVWYPILEDSTKATIDGFSGAVQNSSCALLLVESIANVYVSNTDNFFTKVSQFEAMFQILFVPDTTSETAGKFIPYTDVVDNADDKTVNIRGIDISAGPKSFLPISGVVMNGLPNSDMYLSAPHTTGTNIVAYPDPLPTVGKIVTIGAPNWIPRELIIPQTDTEGTSLNPSEIDLYRKLNAAKLKEVEDSIMTVAKEFAKSFYINNSLEPCVAGIMTLLDLTWEVGKRYNVKQDGGDLLFSGFLKNVEHRISSRPGSTDATTQLTFSHVEANGFTLPNK
jgi:hypothetical protein